MTLELDQEQPGSWKYVAFYCNLQYLYNIFILGGPGIFATTTTTAAFATTTCKQAICIKAFYSIIIWFFIYYTYGPEKQILSTSIYYIIII